MGDTRRALEYLQACSDTSLESFRILRASHAANFRKDVRYLVDRWVEAEVDTELSRCMLAGRRDQAFQSVLRLAHPHVKGFLEHATISLLPGRVEVATFAMWGARLMTPMFFLLSP